MKTENVDLFEGTEAAPVDKLKVRGFKPGMFDSPMHHHDDPQSSREFDKKARINIHTHAWYVFNAVKQSPRLTARELFQAYGDHFKACGIKDKYGVSRALAQLKDKGYVNREDPGRKCSVCKRLCCTWSVKFS